MKTSSVLLLAGALVLAATSALVARALMRPPPPEIVVKEVQVEPPASRQILVAAHDLAPGEFIDGSVLKWQDVPVNDVRAGDMDASRANERELYGATLRRPLMAGQSFRPDVLVRPGEPGFLAAVLQPGMRAISVPTSAVASNAGLVAAGDRVDVILSLERNGVVSASEPDQPPPLAAETILRDVRVLALGDMAASIVPAQAQGESAGAGAGQTRSSRQYFETITLEVDPRQAEKLAVAKELGTLHVALRRVGDDVAEDAGESHVTRLADTTGIFLRTAPSGGAGQPARVNLYLGRQVQPVVFGAGAQ
ncbi:Flp pilus assembly protein CpaB [Alcaligenaceae bacterium SJ-26]|nr:Flp pilus assembly protein CpaB [Alcaligenaceae bacterium SJ-26]